MSALVVAVRAGLRAAADPAHVRPVLRSWARSADRWLRRSADIAQLGAKERTDRQLLAEVVEVNAADPDFFVRKAIGWALRDLAKTDPAWRKDPFVPRRSQARTGPYEGAVRR